MLNFSANLSILFTEVPLIERFALAKQHGFNAVEIQFPYELTIDEIAEQLAINKQQLVLINAPAGDLMQGGDGLACVPDLSMNSVMPYFRPFVMPVYYKYLLSIFWQDDNRFMPICSPVWKH